MGDLTNKRIEAAKEPRRIAFIGPDRFSLAARYLLTRKIAAVLSAERKDDHG